MLKIRFIPSTLESMAMNTISLELWKQTDIVNEIKYLFIDESFRLYIERRKWSKIRERVVEKISHLSLPDLLKRKMEEASEIIGLRIKVWLIKVIRLLPPNHFLDYIHLIRLNSDSGIDTKKTAASILKTLPNMDSYRRYCFACINCLEDDVRGLWKTLPTKYKNILLGIRRGKIQGNYVSDIVIYWSCCISQEFRLLHRRIKSRRRRSNNINDYFIQDSMWHCNSVEMKYFWEKLSEREKSENIVKYAIINVFFDWKVHDTLRRSLVGDPIDICHFLGSQMDEVQLKQMVEQDPYRALHFWCWCEYCHEGFISLDYLWNFISYHDYRAFLLTFVNFRMLYPFESEFIVQKDRRILRKLWENTPNNIKRGFFENVAKIEPIFDSFIITVDVESLQLIFDGATDEERKRIMNHSFSRHLFVAYLEKYCFHYRTYEDIMMLRCLTEEEIDDYLQDILSSFKGKQVKGDLWPFLNIFSNWKTRSSI